jgi:oligopeptide transport system substrate-binding protein
MDYPDPDSMMTVFLGNSGNNHTRWKSKEYDDLVLRAQVERDPAARRALYDRAQSLLCREVTAIVPLYSYTINSLVKPWVRDYPENGLDLLDFRRTRIVEKP